MDVRTYSPSLRAFFTNGWRHRGLILQLSKREVVGRYKGSTLGLLWSFVNPLILLLVYTFVFSVVFKARWGDDHASHTQFAIVLFAGMIVFNVFAECVTRAPVLILNNVNLVKKVVFPLEILPIVALASALFHGGVSLLVLLLAELVLNRCVPWTIIVVPAIVAPLAIMSLGVTYLLSSLGVFFRDVAQTTSLLVTMLMFLSPIFYPISAIPESFRGIISINPLAVPIEQMRQVVVLGVLPNLDVLCLYWAASLILLALCFAWFQKSRRAFADVL